MTLDSQHIQAIDAIRRAMKTPSRVSLIYHYNVEFSNSICTLLANMKFICIYF